MNKYVVVLLVVVTVLQVLQLLASLGVLPRSYQYQRENIERSALNQRLEEMGGRGYEVISLTPETQPGGYPGYEVVFIRR